MKAYLASYGVEKLVNVMLIEIGDDYDGNPYSSDAIPISVGSNQTIVTEDDPRWEKCIELEKESQ